MLRNRTDGNKHITIVDQEVVGSSPTSRPKQFEEQSGMTALSFCAAIFARSFVCTPKALANVSPGLERSDNPGLTERTSSQTLKGFGARRTLSGLIRS